MLVPLLVDTAAAAARLAAAAPIAAKPVLPGGKSLDESEIRFGGSIEEEVCLELDLESFLSLPEIKEKSEFRSFFFQ